MVTRKPRTYISLSERTDAVIGRIARMSRTPKSQVIADLVEEYQPILEQLADAMESLDSLQGAVSRRVAMKLWDGDHYVGALMERAQVEMDELQLSLKWEAEEAKARRREGASRGGHDEANAPSSAGVQPPYINKGAKEGGQKPAKSAKSLKSLKS